ncbi:MAG: hemerythrin domain-containing protein [Chitinophagaceae bacterium]|nr:hemerythrin domain-containing protein [Chitinophagaceae bacterium]
MNQFVMQGSFFAHRALSRDVELLNAIAKRIDQLKQEELDQLKKWYEFFWNMMEAHHAAEDDLLFRAVEERLEAPSEIIEVMEVEHNRLQFLIDEIKRLLGELQRTGPATELNNELQYNAKELLHVFTGHIVKEEKYILEKMKAHFTPAEQRHIENEVKRKAPVRYLSYMVPWLRDSLSPEENKLLDESLPWTARLMNKLFWKNKYDRLIAPVKAMGYS